MPISTKELPPIAEQEMEAGIFLGPPTRSKEKRDLNIHHVLARKRKGVVETKFLLRIPEGIEIGQCTGQDVRDYQEAEGIVIDPFRSDALLNEQDLVLVIRRGSQEIFIMRPGLTSCFARLYDSDTKESMTTVGAHELSSPYSYGFTIELDPEGKLVLSGHSCINPSSY